jgi:hypothetical protein
MREIRSSGSVEGVLSDGHSYSDSMKTAWTSFRNAWPPLEGVLASMDG